MLAKVDIPGVGHKMGGSILRGTVVKHIILARFSLWYEVSRLVLYAHGVGFGRPTFNQLVIWFLRESKPHILGKGALLRVPRYQSLSSLGKNLSAFVFGILIKLFQFKLLYFFRLA